MRSREVTQIPLGISDPATLSKGACSYCIITKIFDRSHCEKTNSLVGLRILLHESCKQQSEHTVVLVQSAYGAGTAHH